MKTRASIQIVMALAALVAMRAPLGAQTRPAEPSTLRAEIERRFDVLPLREGIALRPKRVSDVKSIEISNGVIAVDGQPSTGSELRSRLGADADLVMSLSYMSDSERRVLFAAGAASQAPAPPPTPAPPSPSAAPVPPTPPSVSDTPVPPPPSNPRRSRRRGNDDVVRIGQGVTINEGEVIDGSVVGIGGPVRINGEVHGDAVAVGGVLELGPNASIDGDAVVVGGRMNRADGARVGGGIREVGISGLRMGDWRNWSNGAGLGAMMVGSSLKLVGTFMRLAILCLLAAVVMLIARPYTERVGERAVAEPFKAGAIGFLAQLLFLPVLVVVCVLLAVTIIGIPLLLLVPFAILGLMIVGLVGFTGVAYQSGRWLATRFNWAQDNPYATTFIGIALLIAPVFLARLTGFGGAILVPFAVALMMVGLLIEYVAWTVGFGAVALTRFSPMPPAVVGSSSAGTFMAPIEPAGQGPTTIGP